MIKYGLFQVIGLLVECKLQNRIKNNTQKFELNNKKIRTCQSRGSFVHNLDKYTYNNKDITTRQIIDNCQYGKIVF